MLMLAQSDDPTLQDSDTPTLQTAYGWLVILDHSVFWAAA
jgi:hypothetical protein